MNGYFELLNVIKTSLDNGNVINTVLTSDTVDGFDLDKKNVYPVAMIDVDTGVFTMPATNYNVVVSVLDIADISNNQITNKFLGNSNKIDIYNNLHGVLRRLYNEIKEDKYTKDFNIIGEPSLQKIERGTNLAYGWELTFIVEVPDDVISICDNVFDDTFDNTFN